jgi:hypothetical protein
MLSSKESKEFLCPIMKSNCVGVNCMWWKFIGNDNKGMCRIPVYSFNIKDDQEDSDSIKKIAFERLRKGD